jgi:demethylmenaquinone methyltransferase/2-methoxy-6-polyprenyl-1,4-benzoquinol methylase
MLAAMNPISTEQDAEKTVDFGFRKIAAPAKAGLVQALFDRVAGHYDLMNDLMSLGVHRLWKNFLIDQLAPKPGLKLLDVAGGTGDIAWRALERVGGPGKLRALVVDLSPALIAAGRDRAYDRGCLTGIDWLVGDAEALPLGNRAVEAYTIAFGIRNVTDISQTLAEAHRVLEPGGRFLCLEFSPTVAPGLRTLYELYSFRMIPALGSFIAHDRPAYEYLVESIRRFPDPERFAAMIAAAGFGGVQYHRLSGGIAALHTAWRI